jgi:sulfopyruvate decarboxylase subunit beta
VFTTGYCSRIAASLSSHRQHFYMTGSMGLAAAIAAGAAASLRGPAIAVDGDGSVLMNLGVLASAPAALGEGRLLHLVLDDGVYASTGGQPSGSLSVDLCQVALSAGYQAAASVETTHELRRQVQHFIAGEEQSLFIRCLLTPDDGGVGPRLAEAMEEMAHRVRSAWTST